MDDDIYMPLRSLAMLELLNCTHPCGLVQKAGPYSDRCKLLAGENGMGLLEVMSFCVPLLVGARGQREAGQAVLDKSGAQGIADWVSACI